MKITYIIVFLVVINSISIAQWRMDYGVSVGAANYLGDIGGNEHSRRDFVEDVKLAKTRWAVGGFARYKVIPKISVKLALDYIRIEGDDKLSSNPARNARNLNFRNDLFDLGITGQFIIFEDLDIGNTYRYSNSFNAYVFTGMGVYYSEPKANVDGDYVSLRPLHTEGVNYSAFGVNIPLGFGFYYTFMRRHRLGFEFNYRITFSDYLDDISTTYPSNPNQSGNPNLSLRTPELANANGDNGFNQSFTWGQKRGDSTHNDSYLTMGVSYSIVLRGKTDFYKGRYDYFFKGKKGKKRSVRASF